MIRKIKTGIILTLLIGISSLSWLYRAEIKESAELAQTVLRQQADLGQMESELKRSERLRKKAELIAQKHHKELNAVTQETERLKNEIRELERDNENVQAWSDSDIPRPILDILRNKDDNKD